MVSAGDDGSWSKRGGMRDASKIIAGEVQVITVGWLTQTQPYQLPHASYTSADRD